MATGKGRGKRPKTKQEQRRWAHIGLRLATIRTALNYKDQAAFAKNAKLSQNRYNQYETGERRITLDAALKLKQTYGITLDYIYMADRNGLPHAIWSALGADQPTLQAS
jgi:transcriptional regulator with XRE-family HTH domain